MTAKILDIGELTLELVDPDGTSHWHVTATIADAIVTPIARQILNRTSRIDIDIIKGKIRKNNLGEMF